LEKARYVSGNSGATWVTLPLAALDLLRKKEIDKDIDFTKYLGEYKTPGELKFQFPTNEQIFADNTLDSEMGIIGHVISDADILKTIEENGKKTETQFSDEEKSSRFVAWSEAIEANFVKKLFQFDDKVTFADRYMDIGNAYLWNEPGVNRLTEKRFPFTVFQATGYGENNGGWFPFEFTPLYNGIPVILSEVAKELAKIDIGFWAGLNEKIREYNYTQSGGYTQSIAFNTEVTSDTEKPVPPSAGNEVYIKTLPRPPKVLKIAEISGISSSFLSALFGSTSGAAEKFLKLTLASKFGMYPGIEKPATYNFWSPSSGGKSMKMCFVDGGLLDNTGVIGLLRRKVKTIIACVASDTGIDERVDIAEKFYDIAALFGKGKANAQVQSTQYQMAFNKLQQVFDSNKFDELVNALKDKKMKNLPQVVKMDLDVIPNKLAGVYTSYKVTVVFAVNSKYPDFVNKLPDIQKAEINKPGTGVPADEYDYISNNLEVTLSSLGDKLPFVSTFAVRYDQSFTNALSHMASYTLYEGLKNGKNI